MKIALLTGVLPSLPFVQMHCIEDSSALYSRKLQLVPRSSLSRLQRGLQFACMNKTEDAAKDLERFVESGKQDRDKAILMAFLCQSRAGHEEKAKAALRANLANLHDPSLSSLARFFLGETSEAQVSKPTGSITRDTIVHSNLGYYYLTKGDRSKAKPHLEWALLKGDRKAPEFILALTELERMCGRRSSVNLL